MFAILRYLFRVARSVLKTRRDLALENLALRHQIGVLKRTLGHRRPALRPWDRRLWVTLSRWWQGWRHCLAIVQPATVIRWHQARFRRFWTRKSRHGGPGRPVLDPEVRALIRTLSTANVTWGAPRIRNELAKLGIELSPTTVARYMVRRRKPASPTWQSFLV